MSGAQDRNALENTSILFLQVSGVGKIDLEIPETGLRVRLQVRPDGAKVYDSQGTSVDDINWLKSMSKVIPACQKWMRGQLAK